MDDDNNVDDEVNDSDQEDAPLSEQEELLQSIIEGETYREAEHLAVTNPAVAQLLFASVIDEDREQIEDITASIQSADILERLKARVAIQQLNMRIHTLTSASALASAVEDLQIVTQTLTPDPKAEQDIPQPPQAPVDA